MIRKTVTLLVWLAGCADDTASPTANGPHAEVPANEQASSGSETSDSIPLYAGAASFCTGHVTGADSADGTPGPHISWTAYRTTDGLDEVRAFYTRELGTAHREEAGASWSFPPGRPTRAISLHGASESGPWTGQCNVPPDTGAVLVLSTMARAD